MEEAMPPLSKKSKRLAQIVKDIEKEYDRPATPEEIAARGPIAPNSNLPISYVEKELEKAAAQKNAGPKPLTFRSQSDYEAWAKDQAMRYNYNIDEINRDPETGQPLSADAKRTFSMQRPGVGRASEPMRNTDTSSVVQKVLVGLLKDNPKLRFSVTPEDAEAIQNDTKIDQSIKNRLSTPKQ